LLLSNRHRGDFVDKKDDKIELTAPIKEITIFQGKAMVTRTGQVNVPVGEQSIKLKDLPLSITPDSLRVSGEGTEGALITGVELHRVFDTESLNEERRELEKTYKASLEKEVAIQDELNELQGQFGLLDATAQNFAVDFPKALAYQKAKVEDHQKFTEYITAKRGEISKVLVAKKRDMDLAKKNSAAIKGKLDLTASKAATERNDVDINVRIAIAGPMKITLTYAVSGASWEPVYDVRVMPDTEKVSMTYYGIVTQESGEDWENVALTLSTAPHTEARELPELSPWYITADAPMPKRRFAMAKMSNAPMGSAAPCAPPCEDRAGGAWEKKMDEGPAMEEMAAVTAEVETSGEAVVYKVPGTDTVMSNGEPKKLTVAMLELSCKTEYLSVPKLSPEFYLKAKVSNDTEFVFLAGKVNLFQEDDYIGATYIDTKAPKEKFDLSLGVTRQIVIKRELVKKETESAGITGSGTRMNYAYEIKVENHRKAKAKLIIMDQLPIPSNKDIKIEKVVLDPEPKETDDMKRIKWKLFLDPEQKKTISLQFSVEYPSKITVYGLPEG
jgi:uncharacterized protein (TIGR02231 family)